MKSAATALIVLGMFSAAPALADEDLARSKNCLACHALDKGPVGPSWKAIVEKYGSQDGAAEQLAGKIIKGSSGVWGPIPMPPNMQVNEEQARQLAEWVLAQ